MKFKKTVFGGYKRSEVDLLAGRWEEDEEFYKSRISILESELNLLKDSSEKEISEWKSGFSEKENIIGDLQNKLLIAENTLKTINEKLQNEKEANSELVRTIKANENVVKLYEAEIIRLGRLYLDALDYSEKIKTEAKESSAEVVNRIFSEITKTESEYSEFINHVCENKKSIEIMADKIEASLNEIRDFLEQSENGISDIGNIYLRLENEKNSLIRNIMREDKHLMGTYDTYKKKEPEITKTFEPEFPEAEEENAQHSNYLDKIEKKYTQENQTQENQTQDSSTKPQQKPSIKDILEKYSNLN